MALTIKTSFNIPVSQDVAWLVLTDIERSAPCFPGAELGEPIEGGFYKGAFNVKLGPLSFRFSGKFGYIEMDKILGTAKISASGTDTKGRGGAQAVISVSMKETDGFTLVDIVSDVTLSGMVAQYGRGAGMIQALSQQLINDFAGNLSKIITTDSAQSNSPSSSHVAHPSESAPNSSTDNVTPAATSTPLSGGNLLWRVFLNWIKSLFSKKTN
jgi:carbon monoxide dehydrogenase subunit G